jgi:hypothetical protein
LGCRVRTKGGKNKQKATHHIASRNFTIGIVAGLASCLISDSHSGRKGKKGGKKERARETNKTQTSRAQEPRARHNYVPCYASQKIRNGNFGGFFRTVESQRIPRQFEQIERVKGALSKLAWFSLGLVRVWFSFPFFFHTFFFACCCLVVCCLLVPIRFT